MRTNVPAVRLGNGGTHGGRFAMEAEGMRTKVCRKCGLELDLDQFYRNKGAKDGFGIKCKDCIRGSKRALLLPMTCAECGKTYQPKNGNQRFCSYDCAKINIKKGYFIIFERDQFRCIYCGRSSIEDGVKLNIEHIIPYEKGGCTRAYNLVTSCAECNLRKAVAVFGDDILERLKAVVSNRNKYYGIPDNQCIKSCRGTASALSAS